MIDIAMLPSTIHEDYLPKEVASQILEVGKSTIGQKIKHARIKKELSKQDLATLLEISLTQLEDIENNRSVPSNNTLVRCQD